MKSTLLRGFAAASAVLLLAPAAPAADILSLNDTILAIDLDGDVPESSYPDAETPQNALDNNAGSKYLNFGGTNSGFITTVQFPSDVIQSIRFTTANDAIERDPTSYEIYGTNDAITDVDNGFGDAENWTQIANGTLTLPELRGDSTTLVDFSNSTAYTSYRVVFPTLRDAEAANSMQIADVSAYNAPAGGGNLVFDTTVPTIAFDLDRVPNSSYNANEGPQNLLDGAATPSPIAFPTSRYPAAEFPANVVDQDSATKYLNFGGTDSGFIVTPASGPAAVQSFQLTTANDSPERDPASYEIFGTNDAITSPDNGFGNQENWVSLGSGTLALPDDRLTLGTPAINITNSTAYSSYKVLFPTVKDGAAANSMQVADAQFFTGPDGSGSAVLATGDAVLGFDQTLVGGTQTKYLNFGAENAGFIVQPGAGSSVVDQFQIISANDFQERDPATWELYGTNDAVTSTDNSDGSAENWVLIDSGTFDDTQVTPDRETTGALVDVSNTTEYSAYRMVFPTIRDINDVGETVDAGAVQIAGIQFFGDVNAPNVDTNGDGKVDGTDFLALQRTDPSLIGAFQAAYGTGVTATAAGNAVPEPTTGALLLIGLIATSALGRGRVSRAAS